jgi:heptosyltransferase-2
VAPARVLVRLPNWLGDAIMARPLLHALRTAWPAARVLGVGPEGPGSPLAEDGVLDERVTVPRDAASRAAALAQVRRFAPELAFVLPSSFSSAWLALRSGARTRIGFAGEWRDALLTHALRRAPRGDQHLSDEFLALGAAAGLAEVPVPLLAPSAAGREQAAAVLAGSGIGALERYVLIGPRSAYGPAREWFPERFADAARALAARGLRVVVTGTAAEAASCAAVAAHAGPAAVSVAGRTRRRGTAGAV